MVVIIMGVSGCGKSTVGAALAQARGWRFLDADDFHPAANKAKMQAGTALTDEDRRGWLDALAEQITAHQAKGLDLVLACSALKEAYRERLRKASRYRLVYLAGTREVLAERLAGRTGHFMNPGLLDSQLATLEEPVDALQVPVSLPVDEIIRRIETVLPRG
jgi:gluconokinase